MKKLTWSLVLCLVVLFGIFTSCNNDDAVETTESSVTITDAQNITIEKGMLKFASAADLESTIASLIKDQNSLEQWESQFSDYTSMRTAYENISEKDIEMITNNKLDHKFKNIVTITGNDDDLEARMHIDDLVLATLTNENGLLQIGDQVYKITYNTLYKASEKNIESLLAIEELKNNKSMEESGIETFEVTHQYYTINGSDTYKADRTCDKRYWKKNRKRLKGEQWTTNIGSLYSGAGARTKHQKRSLRIWWRDRTQKLRLKLNGSYTQVFNGIPQPSVTVNSDSGWKNDDGREAYTFDFCINVSCSFSINNLTSTHECICDDGNYEKCDIVF